jgi:hypothetical protein
MPNGKNYHRHSRKVCTMTDEKDAKATPHAKANVVETNTGEYASYFARLNVPFRTIAVGS